MKQPYLSHYFKAINLDTNALQDVRVKSADKVEIKQIEKQLAGAFLDLAELMSDNIFAARECVLTAFSLYPSQTTLEKIEDFARRSGKVASKITEEQAGENFVEASIGIAF